MMCGTQGTVGSWRLGPSPAALEAEGPRETAEACLPRVRTEAAAESALRTLHALQLCRGWTSQDRTWPQFNRKCTCRFWPDGDLLGGGPRRPLS